jgi:hypothetical protein
MSHASRTRRAQVHAASPAAACACGSGTAVSLGTWPGGAVIDIAVVPREPVRSGPVRRGVLGVVADKHQPTTAPTSANEDDGVADTHVVSFWEPERPWSGSIASP